MNIVAATDFSTRSNRALRQAGLLVRSPDAKLHLVHVVDEDQPAELIRIEEQEAQRVLVEQVASMPELHNVQRKQFLRDIFTGTTIERVIRGGNIAPGDALGALVGVTFSCVSGN
ncbi:MULTISPECIES: universal stress protein [unclassified Bradyrhizobium]|uniref:universal stress protein n=1 Tax=unclassified Bradyrhizobium TaxID=2631580 RepID=UPI001FF9F33C|nr:MULTISPECIES: universal stress protein [unclassified Bradyrhizobium]